MRDEALQILPERVPGGRTRRSQPALELEPVSIPSPASEPAAIPAALLRQIQHQASLKGVEIPEFSTADEAKSFLKNLMAAQ